MRVLSVPPVQRVLLYISAYIHVYTHTHTHTHTHIGVCTQLSTLQNFDNYSTSAAFWRAISAGGDTVPNLLLTQCLIYCYSAFENSQQHSCVILEQLAKSAGFVRISPTKNSASSPPSTPNRGAN